MSSRPQTANQPERQGGVIKQTHTHTHETDIATRNPNETTRKHQNNSPANHATGAHLLTLASLPCEQKTYEIHPSQRGDPSSLDSGKCRRAAVMAGKV